MGINFRRRKMDDTCGRPGSGSSLSGKEKECGNHTQIALLGEMALKMQRVQQGGWFWLCRQSSDEWKKMSVGMSVSSGMRTGVGR